ncbi:hypothetical protein K474DRAFT_719567 [Panus rudis PR-1116 ss-1]|nr:hypothetical protein K474DRAFT_719567 [Panus rudis PR-1116 ss-1]
MRLFSLLAIILACTASVVFALPFTFKRAADVDDVHVLSKPASHDPRDVYKYLIARHRALEVRDSDYFSALARESLARRNTGPGGQTTLSMRPKRPVLHVDIPPSSHSAATPIEVPNTALGSQLNGPLQSQNGGVPVASTGHSPVTGPNSPGEHGIEITVVPPTPVEEQKPLKWLTGH